LPTSVLALLLAALTLSWLGDVLLEFFLVGLSFFLVAHLAYIVLFHLAFRRRASWWALGLIPWFGGLLLALAPYLDETWPAVAAYGAVLAYMAAAASRGNALTMIGGALFVASDSFLAFRMFTPLFPTPSEDAFIMALYLAAQLVLALGVLRTAIPRPAVRTSVPSRPTAAASTGAMTDVVVKKVRTRHFQNAKANGIKITGLTSYDQLTAAIFDRAGIDCLLVGDSAGNNVFGYDTTLPVTVDELIPLTRAVAGAVKRAFVVGDLPFGSYETSPDEALHTAF